MFALLAAGTYNRGARQPAPASRGKVPAIPDLSRRRFLTISAAATLAGAAAVATSACASHTRGGTEMPSRILRGVTVDSLDDIEETAAVLSSSANRLTVRLVMDFITNSAMGLRQMFPKQTNTIFLIPFPLTS